MLLWKIKTQVRNHYWGFRANFPQPYSEHHTLRSKHSSQGTSSEEAYPPGTTSRQKGSMKGVFLQNTIQIEKWIDIALISISRKIKDSTQLSSLKSPHPTDFPFPWHPPSAHLHQKSSHMMTFFKLSAGDALGRLGMTNTLSFTHPFKTI